MHVFFRFLLMFLFSANLWAANVSSSWYTQDADKKTTINVELFLSSTCPHCHKADEFFNKIQPQMPWLHIQRYVINEDKNALIRFNALLNEQHMDDFAVPSVFFCNSRWVGFVSDETTGKDLLKALNYCKQQIEKKGELTGEAVSVLKHWANANMFDSGMIEHPSVVQYITLMALMDAVNPCAYFCLAGFLGLLFLQDSQKRRLVVGLFFILSMAIVHYTQQVHTNTFFEWLPWLRWPAVLVGLFTYYLAGQHYRKRSIHHLFILLAFLLAIMIQAYQQTCLMNWSFIFEQWLYNQHFNNRQVALYQLAYQSLYILPPIVTLMLYLIFTRTEYFAKRQQLFNTIGLLFIMAIALILIVYPLALSNFLLSFFIVVTLVVLGWILNKLKNK